MILIPPYPVNPKITREGELVVNGSDEGFSPDSITIDDIPVSELISILFGITRNAKGSIGSQNLGRVRLTLEKLP